MIVHENRASTILFRLLAKLGDARPFLLPDNVCSVVPRTLAAAGQRYECVDISAAGPQIDEEAVLERVRVRPAAYAGIIYVHAYGSEHDPTQFFGALREITPLLIVDDKCLCPPDVEGEALSPFADVTLYSTGRAKHTDVEYGGFAYLSDGIMYDAHHATPPWLHGSTPDKRWPEYRLEVQNASRTARQHKSVLNAIYAERLPREIQLDAYLQHWRFNICVSEPDRLLRSIFDAGLFASRHYEPITGLPNARALHGRIVNLFNDHYFDESRAIAVTDIVLRHLRS